MIEEFQETVTTFANQDDRWLFMAMLLVFILSVGWMVRYFTAQVEAARLEAKELNSKFMLHMEQAHSQMVRVIESNTEALRIYKARQ
jgi:Tat protein secretion system quality control protein TatD with DNase activity